MNDNLNDRVLPEVSTCQMMGQFTKGQVLSMGREIPCVLKVPPTARELFYQCLIRCDADGRIRSFSACARAAGIVERARPLQALKKIGLVYKLPHGGGGFNLEKLLALYQQALALRERVGSQIATGGVANCDQWGSQIATPYKTLKKKKDTRVTREGSFFDDTRSRSSWRYRNARQSQDWDDDGATTMVCSTEVI